VIAMDPIEKFVCEQNIARWRQQLETETNAGRGSAVIRLLVAEETKLGLTLEHLAGVDRYIGRCRALIARQKAIIEELHGNGHDVSQARVLLDTLMQSLTTHERYRSGICNEIDRVNL